MVHPIAPTEELGEVGNETRVVEHAAQHAHAGGLDLFRCFMLIYGILVTLTSNLSTTNPSNPIQPFQQPPNVHASFTRVALQRRVLQRVPHASVHPRSDPNVSVSVRTELSQFSRQRQPPVQQGVRGANLPGRKDVFYDEEAVEVEDVFVGR